MRRGFRYLVAIMDWASRKVLAWRLSNTMDADFCVAALEEAITKDDPTTSRAVLKDAVPEFGSNAA
jgi:transposase InsO family protein